MTFFCLEIKTFFVSLFFISVTSGCVRFCISDENLNISIYNEKRPGVVSIAPVFEEKLKNYSSKSPASGTIIDKNGTILTNYHVVGKVKNVSVTLFDGSVWPGTVTGKDPGNDLAVIKINAPNKKFFAIDFGDSSKVRVGAKVLAIGNPFGLTGTLTTGIVSSTGRSIKTKSGRVIKDVIQTDTSINPGHSGGPLLNSRGEMIALNTALLSTSGGNAGIAFSVSVKSIRKVLPDLLTKGYVIRPWSGIVGRFVDSDLALELDLPYPGILVSDALRNSPAGKAGLRGGEKIVNIGFLLIAKGGDLIVSYDGRQATDMEGLNEYVEDRQPGEKIRLTIYRDKRLMDLEVTLSLEPQDIL